MTREDRLGIIWEYREIRSEADKTKDRFVEAIFNRELLGKYVDSLVEELFGGETVTVKGINDYDRVPVSKYSDLHREVANLLNMQFTSEKIVSSKMLESYDWNQVIVEAIYLRHRSISNFMLVDDELNKLRDICLKEILQYRDKSIVSIIEGEYRGIYK